MARRYTVSTPNIGRGGADLIRAGGGGVSMKAPKAQNWFSSSMSDKDLESIGELFGKFDDLKEKVSKAGYDTEHLSISQLKVLSTKIDEAKIAADIASAKEAKTLLEAQEIGGTTKDIFEAQGGGVDSDEVAALRAQSMGITDIPGRNPFKGLVGKGEDVGGRLSEMLGAQNLPDPFDPGLGIEDPGERFLLDEATGMYVSPTTGAVFENKRAALEGREYMPEEGHPFDPSLEDVRGGVGITRNKPTEDELSDYRAAWVQGEIEKLPKESQDKARRRLARNYPDPFFAKGTSINILGKFFGLREDAPYDPKAKANLIRRQVEEDGKRWDVFVDVRDQEEQFRLPLGDVKDKDKITWRSGYDKDMNPVNVGFDKASGEFVRTVPWPKGLRKTLPRAGRSMNLKFTAWLHLDENGKRIVEAHPGIIYDPVDWYQTGSADEKKLAIKYKNSGEDRFFAEILSALQSISEGGKRPSPKVEEPTGGLSLKEKAKKIAKEKRKGK